MIQAIEGRGHIMSHLLWVARRGRASEEEYETEDIEAESRAKVVPTVASGSGSNGKSEVSVEREKNLSKMTLAHDMAAPLSLVSNAAWSLKKGCPEEDKAFYVDCILRNAVSLQNLVEDFRDAEREQAGHLEIHREELNLAAVAREVVTDFQTINQSHPMSFYGDDAYILGDKERIRRLLFNLIGNAVKYSEAGREVKVDVWRRGTNICLFVQDEGKGVAPAETERIFLPFTRLEQKSSLISGDGLGLSSVKRIADAHGATIGVQGAVGHGTIFEVCFKALDRRESE